MFRGDRLKEIRELRKLSQRELASRCHMGEKQIWRYENGDSNPTADHVAKISRELDVSSDYLLDLTNEAYIHFTEEELSPMEHKLITAIRHGLIKEALKSLTAISESNDQAGITSNKETVDG